ncbi:MAG: hypothetical protein LCH84_16455 [Gemmatimonadetes bacterium]|nr:hypothetical protein [Gemmatimonadota bacterium]
MRSVWIRPLAALYALWFFVVSTGAGGIGTCALHGPGGHGGGHGGDHGGAQSDAHAAHGAHAAHAGHAMPAASEVSDAGRERSDQPRASCSCVGDCCMITPAALPAPAELPAVTTGSTARTPTPEYRSVLAARRAFAQPYAIGPPTNAPV